ncbi:MAG TPA: MBL fold metallo-hydrolase [Patescibacteria group bacterium]|nr:MBL fold metallo-hydrolase [Patescibacteria group bacterium]
MYDIITLRVGQMAANCYLVVETKSKEGIIIDPGDDAEYIIDTLTKRGINPTAIIATHGHFDHIMAAFAIQKTYDIPVYVHANDIFLVGRMRESAKHFLGIDTDPEPDVTPISKKTLHGFTMLATPGHTPGSICLAGDGVLFTGDTIFANGAVGRTDHTYSSHIDLLKSIQSILSLPARTKIYPGHGDPTTVGKERLFHVQ